MHKFLAPTSVYQVNFCKFDLKSSIENRVGTSKTKLTRAFFFGVGISARSRDLKKYIFTLVKRP